MRFDIFIGDDNVFDDICLSLFDVSAEDAKVIARVVREHCSSGHDILFRPLYSDGGDE